MKNEKTLKALTKGEMRQYHFIRGDAEGLVNEPLRIKGMRLSISLREDTERENTIWVSLRSIDQYYCNDIAEKFFNGGGHDSLFGCSAKRFCSFLIQNEELSNEDLREIMEMIEKEDV